jgi:magnesium chelatase subunit D
MADADDWLSAPFVRLLACAALSPGLRSVLLYDADPGTLDLATSLLGRLLRLVTGDPVERVVLGAADNDEDLWGRQTPVGGRGELHLEWRPGALVQEHEGTRVVVAYDLARLSLSTIRAAVMLAGAEVGHLQRHAMARTWQPSLCWLASLASEDAGKVSPHLLDRFALRSRAALVPDEHRVHWLTRQLAYVRGEAGPTLEGMELPLPARVAGQVRRASTHRLEVGGPWTERLSEYFPTAGMREGTGWRREITLARLAVAEARLSLAAYVTSEHVDRAAALIGLRSAVSIAEGGAPQAASHNQTLLGEPGGAANPAVPAPSRAELRDNSDGVAAAESMDVHEPDAEQLLDPRALSTPSLEGRHPYEEDTHGPERDPDSLRLPPRPTDESRAAHGPIVGTRPTDSLRDLAVASTVIHAAMYQPIRRRSRGLGDTQWVFLPNDLRAYRRSPVPEKLLTLVLDHTSLPGCAWDLAVQPHLHWAYVKRAAICLVSVGTAQGATRAERLMVRNLLAPQLVGALTERPGNATPLAHGLELALQALRHATQHGRAAAREARLVVLTDGRGNVPLASGAIQFSPNRSPSCTPAGAVGTAGIEDAIRVARGIGRLKHVRTFMLDPQPRHYAELPRRLADALSATLIPVARRGAEISEA